MGAGFATGAAIVGTAAMDNSNKRTILHEKRTDAKDVYTETKSKVTHQKWTLESKVEETQQDINCITDEIEEEEKKIYTHTSDSIDSSNTKCIVVLGSTGQGKSTVLNRLCGDTSEEGDNGPFKTDDTDEPGFDIHIYLYIMYISP